MNRERQTSGISLQNMRAQMQMSLIEQQIPPEADKPQRRIIIQEGGSTFCQNMGTQISTNVIRNQKYNIITFIPVVLYHQFKYFFNLFYLLTALSQFIPILKVGLLFSFVSPLVLVLTLTMLKEAYEDYQRYCKDKQINSALFIKLEGFGKKSEVKSCDIRAGDILQVGVGDNIPADCLLIASLTDKPSVFIKTDQLDGQTDWKLRKPQLQLKDHKKIQIEYMAPTVNIYEFFGSMRVDGEAVGLGLEQTLWRGVKIASGKGLVLVIYTGKQTKLSLNSKESGNKFGLLDEQLNFFSKILFIIMLSLSITLVILRGSYGAPGESFILLFKYFLLLSTIIPISMRVNLDFAKLIYKYQIDHDQLLPGCQCRNSNIPQQLGRIQYVLSDKTGTLTQNEMIFRKLLLSNDIAFEPEDIPQLKQILQQENIKQSSYNQRSKESRVQDAVLSLVLCHNVTPVFDNSTRILQGSSPDQITLVSFAQTLGYLIKERNESSIVLQTSKGQTSYQILEMFPFTSQSKSMGIIIRQNNKITYYLKGADSIMQTKISQTDGHFMAEACLDLAKEGLRTLVIAQKILTEDYYLAWKKQLIAAGASLKNRDEKIADCRQKLEKGMVFVAVTGVEDKLQKGVMQTVGSLRSIGIKVWMLTGDKVETAICVGRAVRLIQGRDQRLFLIENAKTKKAFLQKLADFYKFLDLDLMKIKSAETINCVLVIDGTSLGWALKQAGEEFFSIAVKLPAIICSRVSPTQKAEVALLVRQFGSGRVLGIGDGGNDVALIQSAHVGVGIYGKEGIQAALASDFSISQFQQLNGLIYWHGRLAYKRSCLLSQFIIHRGMIITIMQTIFTIQFFFVALPIYNGILLLGYSTIFTMLPVFSLVLDEDISRQVAMDYPILYKSTQAGNQLNLITFLYWIIISIYQGAIIMILIDQLVGQQSFYMINTISFTCLIFIEFLNIFTEIHRVKITQLISILLSIVIYILSIFLMRNTLNGVELFSTAYLPATAIIVGVAWVPPFVYELVKRLTNPSQQQKIMSQKSLLNKISIIS